MCLMQQGQTGKAEFEHSRSLQGAVHYCLCGESWFGGDWGKWVRGAVAAAAAAEDPLA